MLHKKCITVSN